MGKAHVGDGNKKGGLFSPSFKDILGGSLPVEGKCASTTIGLRADDRTFIPCIQDLDDFVSFHDDLLIYVGFVPIRDVIYFYNSIFNSILVYGVTIAPLFPSVTFMFFYNSIYIRS
jgi:hypothetical protein